MKKRPLRSRTHTTTSDPQSSTLPFRRTRLAAAVSLLGLGLGSAQAATLVVGIRWESEAEPPLAVMRRLALDLQDRFERLPGTELTETYGLPSEEVRVVMDPDALAATGLSFRQAAAALAAADNHSLSSIGPHNSWA